MKARFLPALVFVLSVLCNVAPSAAKAADEAVPNHPVLSDRVNF